MYYVLDFSFFEKWRQITRGVDEKKYRRAEKRQITRGVSGGLTDN